MCYIGRLFIMGWFIKVWVGLKEFIGDVEVLVRVGSCFFLGLGGLKGKDSVVGV